MAKSGKGLMLLLGGPPKSKGKPKSEDIELDDEGDEYPEDTADDTGGNERAAFNTHAEEALGTSDPAKLDALWQAIKTAHEEMSE